MSDDDINTVKTGERCLYKLPHNNYSSTIKQKPLAKSNCGLYRKYFLLIFNSLYQHHLNNHPNKMYIILNIKTTIRRYNSFN